MAMSLIPISKHTIDPFSRNIHLMYHQFRFVILWLAVLFPVLLLAVGYLVFGIEPQNSISAYYYAQAKQNMWVDFPMRVLFVGGLWTLGVMLYVYKGYTRKENNALNLAGLAAVCVAIFPMTLHYKIGDDLDKHTRFYPHYIAAVSLFLCMIYVALFTSNSTVRRLKDKSTRKYYRAVYRSIGVAMLLFPLVAFIVANSFGNGKQYVFWLEACGVWSFAAYWFFKNKEMLLHTPVHIDLSNPFNFSLVRPMSIVPDMRISENAAIEVKPQEKDA